MSAVGSACPATFFRERFPDFWAEVAGEPYAMFDAWPMSAADVAEIRSAGADAWRILTRIAPVLRALPDAELRAIGIPAAALGICRRTDATLGESLIARFDFALTPDGPKVLELNAETPMFVWESFEIAGAVARALGFDDPNAGCAAALQRAVRKAVGASPNVRVAVTAYNTWREDWFSAVYAASVATAALGRRVDAIPLHELRVTGGALRDATGMPIDVLWRLYPLEQIAADRDGPKLFELVAAGTVRLVNPPSGLLLQNKAAQAITWELAERGAWFDPAERAVIERRFLPTYLECPADSNAYVRKPVLGREGDSVAIVRGAEIVAAAPAQHYAAQPVVYQRYTPLPQLHGGHAIATCFVVDGVPSAVALRVGSAITDNRARFLPIGVPPAGGAKAAR